MQENSNVSNNGMSNSQSNDDSCLIEGMEESHYPIPVLVPLYCQLLLLIKLLAGGFILAIFYRSAEFGNTDTFSAVIYLHVIVWMLIMLLTWYVKAEHKTSRILGYHDFYDSTRHLHRVAFYLLSGGNVLFLIVSCVTHNFCLSGGLSPCGSSTSSLTPVNYLQIIIVIEVVLAVPLLIKHVVEVFRFNQSQLPPDVLRGHSIEQLHQRELLIGVRGSGYLEKLLNQQADQLMTLNYRNQMLYQQLFSLTQNPSQSVTSVTFE